MIYSCSENQAVRIFSSYTNAVLFSMDVITFNNFRDQGFETIAQLLNLKESKGQVFLIASIKDICLK